jgi:hypothetical protein
MYRCNEHLSRINVTTVAGVTVIGDGNVVNAKLTDLSVALSSLEDAVALFRVPHGRGTAIGHVRHRDHPGSATEASA